MKFYASAARGMSSLLATELHRLGANKVVPAGAGVSFEGNIETAYRVCLWSRIASRLLLPLTTVAATTPEQLYDEVKAIRWEKHLHSRNTFAIDAYVTDTPTKSNPYARATSPDKGISHSKYAALKAKDAIADRFREQFGERPSVELAAPDIRIHLHIRGDRVRISLDLSGSSLHRRGYRAEGVIAPLKENLGAAILLEAGWPAIARNGGALLDPMCGSGTLLIEGALIAADIAPGLYRDYFGFLGWRRHDDALWQQLLTEAEQRRKQGLTTLPPIIGYDSELQSVSAAESNIAAAGLGDHIRIARQDLEHQLPEPPAEHGLLVVNPPYGGTVYRQPGTGGANRSEKPQAHHPVQRPHRMPVVPLRSAACCRRKYAHRYRYLTRYRRRGPDGRQPPAQKPQEHRQMGATRRHRLLSHLRCRPARIRPGHRSLPR
jgi:23S rRNA (guanine2445-N2)-methyltransferase / 23S rRNA (guanine2069-N7)-methyltransferase